MITQNAKGKTILKDRCYQYSVRMIKFINTLPEKQAYRIISDQLLRSATSIGANIIEAKSASSKRDFIKYYEIALKSANETEYWLGLMKDALSTNELIINGLFQETHEISNIIAASLLTMKGKRQL